LRSLFLPMFPGDDVWRYLWEGHIQNLGFSPYHLAPTADVLVQHQTVWWSMINHPDTSAIYPPITQFGFRALAAIVPAVLLFKLAFVAADLMICGMLAHRFGHQKTLIYAWNPLILYSFAGGAHYDPWFLLPLVAAWLVFDRESATQVSDIPESQPQRRYLRVALLLGISIAVKWISLPILGFVAWRSLRQVGWRVAVLVSATGIVPMIVSALPFCWGGTCPLVPVQSDFVTQGRSAEFIPHFVTQILPASRWENWLYAFPLALIVLWLLFRSQTFRSFSEWYFMLLLLLSPVVHAWYFCWIVPFTVASGNWTGRLVSLSAFTYFGLQYRLSIGDTSWALTDLERAILWVPFLIGILQFAIRSSGNRQPELKHSLSQ
ncbi:MAG: glycosyl transferase family 2, partial [Cyanobacteria bacterium P01_H01_bin.121]